MAAIRAKMVKIVVSMAVGAFEHIADEGRIARFRSHDQK
jgi:hypothetical protein